MPFIRQHNSLSMAGGILRKGNFKWNLVFGYANMLLAMAFGVFMVPVYLKYITTDAFGAWLASGNILVWLVAINPGISTVIQERVGNLLGQNNLSELSYTICSGIFITIVVSFLAATIGVLFSEQAIAFLRLESEADSRLMVKAFTLAAVSVGLLLFSEGIVAVMHGLHSSYFVGISGMISYVIAIGATLFFLMYGYGVLSIPCGSLVRGVSLVFLNAGYLNRKLKKQGVRLSFQLANMKDIVGLFSYNFLGRLSGIITVNSESVIIARYFAAEAVTPIILTKRLPQVFQGTILIVAQALFPSLAHMNGENNHKSIRDVLIKVCSIVFWLLGFMTVFFILFNEHIVSGWVGASQYAGEYFNVIICGSVLISVISHFFAEVSAALGEIKKSGFATLAQSILFVPVVWISINLFGLAGVIIGPAISMAAVSGWYYFYLLAKKGHLRTVDMRIIGKEIFITMFISLLLYVMFSLIKIMTLVELICAISVYCLSYLILLLLMSNRFRDHLKIALVFAKRRCYK